MVSYIFRSFYTIASYKSGGRGKNEGMGTQVTQILIGFAQIGVLVCRNLYLSAISLLDDYPP